MQGNKKIKVLNTTATNTEQIWTVHSAAGQPSQHRQLKARKFVSPCLSRTSKAYSSLIFMQL